MAEENIKEEIVQPQPTENSPIKKQKPWLMIVIIILLSISLGSVGVLAYENYLLKNRIQTKEKEFLSIPTISPIATPTSSINSSVNNSTEWQIFETKNFTFKYPPNSRVEEISEGYFSIIENKETVADLDAVTIDARQTEEFYLADYNVAIEKAKQNLENTTSQPIKNGVKISGTVGPGYGEGLKVIEALIKYNLGAVRVETLANIAIASYFDEIVDSISFIKSK